VLLEDFQSSFIVSYSIGEFDEGGAGFVCSKQHVDRLLVVVLNGVLRGLNFDVVHASVSKDVGERSAGHSGRVSVERAAGGLTVESLGGLAVESLGGLGVESLGRLGVEGLGRCSVGQGILDRHDNGGPQCSDDPRNKVAGVNRRGRLLLGESVLLGNRDWSLDLDSLSLHCLPGRESVSNRAGDGGGEDLDDPAHKSLLLSGIV